MRAPSDIWFGTSGPRDAEIAIVGEAWGLEEMAQQRPFVGGSGKELDRMLSDAGIDRAKCFATNVIPARPPSNEMWRFFEPTKQKTQPALRGLFPNDAIRHSVATLHQQLLTIQPKVVLACGNYALWALTHCTGFSTPTECEGRRVPSGIDSWRGSMWFCDASPAPLPNTRLIPILHPAGIMREWYKRAVTVQDLRVRVPMALRGDWRPQPAPVTLTPPSFEEAGARLRLWLAKASAGERLRLVSDVETVPRHGLLACAGFADSEHFAMTIPFILPRDGGRRFDSYWTEAQEFTLVKLIRQVLTHPNILVEGQNYLYDTQWFVAFLACQPRCDFDTMLAHHLLFPGTPKGLDYLSSLYCNYHWYWKDDGKEWDVREEPEKLWNYNGLDCLRQYECGTVLRDLIPRMCQERQWVETLERNALALRMMRRGVLINQAHRGKLAYDLAIASSQFEAWFLRIVPQEWLTTNSDKHWYRSNLQQRQLFSEVLGLRLPLHRKTGRQTLGAEGMATLAQRHPEYRRLFTALEDYRSLEVFHNTFIKAPLDPDGRMRCMFNVAGTETFRWSSSENAFGRGTNLQNIPSGTED
jgi:uracil-DNA glycosylase family 4